MLSDATLIDAGHPVPVPHQTMILADDRITAIQPTGKLIPDSAIVIDLGGKYLLPGLIDSHVHMATDPRTKSSSKGGVNGDMSYMQAITDSAPVWSHAWLQGAKPSDIVNAGAISLSHAHCSYMKNEKGPGCLETRRYRRGFLGQKPARPR